MKLQRNVVKENLMTPAYGSGQLSKLDEELVVVEFLHPEAS